MISNQHSEDITTVVYGELDRLNSRIEARLAEGREQTASPAASEVP